MDKFVAELDAFQEFERLDTLPEEFHTSASDPTFQDDEREELRRVCRPVVEFIQKHYGSPHHSILIDWNSAVLIEDLKGVGFKTPD